MMKGKHMKLHAAQITKRNQKGIWIGFAALVFLLAGMTLLRVMPSNESRFSRKVEDNFFSLDMERLNCTIAEPFSLKKADTIDVNVVHISGELSISIGQENQKPIYEGRNPELSSFRVTIPEDGNYSLSVSGKQAKGSISLQINTTSD